MERRPTDVSVRPQAGRWTRRGLLSIGSLGALGLTHTRLYADDRPNTTTAAEMGALLSWIATRTPPGPGGTS